MDFAFSAFLILLLVLPGVIFRFAYLRGTTVNNPFVITSLTDEIASGVIAAGVLHALWCLVADGVHHPVDFKTALTLLVGTEEDHPAQLSAAIAASSRSMPLIAEYFLSLYVAAAAFGLLVHWAVRKTRLDHTVPLLRYHNEWYYILSGEYQQFSELRAQPWSSRRKPDVVYLSTVIPQGDEPYLYRGYIVDYSFDKEGLLDRVVLCDAKRRSLKNDREPIDPHKVEGDDRYYAIVGDLLILKYSEMQTMNIQGIRFTETSLRGD